jgi:hypothetical protein
LATLTDSAATVTIHQTDIEFLAARHRAHHTSHPVDGTAA